MRTTLLAALVGCVILTACASSPNPDSASRRSPSATAASRTPAPAGDASTAPVATSASNKTEALAEINRVLALMPLPSGSVQQPNPSPSDGGPAMGRPGVADFVSVTTIWRVPLPYDQVMTWARDHRPDGYTEAGTMTTGGPSNVGLGTQFDAPADPVAPDNDPATLSLSAEPVSGDASASTWRVNASDVWFDPSPVPVRTDGPTLHVAVSSGCPSALGNAVDVSNTAPSSDTIMLPDATPTAGLVCTFQGLNTSGVGLLSKHRTLDATEASALASQVKALKLGSTGMGAHSCPMDDNGVKVLVFSYPAGDVDLWWHDSGCPSLDNGDIVVTNFSLQLPS